MSNELPEPTEEQVERAQRFLDALNDILDNDYPPEEAFAFRERMYSLVEKCKSARKRMDQRNAAAKPKRPMFTISFGYAGLFTLSTRWGWSGHFIIWNPLLWRMWSVRTIYTVDVGQTRIFKLCPFCILAVEKRIRISNG